MNKILIPVLLSIGMWVAKHPKATVSTFLAVFTTTLSDAQSTGGFSYVVDNASKSGIIRRNIFPFDTNAVFKMNYTQFWTDTFRIRAVDSMHRLGTVTDTVGIVVASGTGGVRAINKNLLRFNPENLRGYDTTISGINSRASTVIGKKDISDTTGSSGYVRNYQIGNLSGVYYPLNSNPSGYLTNATAGYGIAISGTTNKVVAIDSNQVMTVPRATDSINSINSKVNGKASNSTILTINGVSQNISANRTWTVGTLVATDTVALSNRINAKFNIPSGTNLQYVRGDGSLATFPTTGTGTVTSITAGTGLSGGTITTTGTISMPNTGTAGTYGSNSTVPVITTDAQGRVSGVTNTAIRYPGQDTARGYLLGTPYTLTTTSAKITGGTQSPSIVVPAPGTYKIDCNVTIEYNGITTLSVNASSFKVRRTNNTAADIPFTTQPFNIPILTLTTQTGGDLDLPSFYYTTSNSNDVLEIWGNLGASISVGSVRISSGYMIAQRLF